jgi:hypothetical protein
MIKILLYVPTSGLPLLLTTLMHADGLTLDLILKERRFYKEGFFPTNFINSYATHQNNEKNQVISVLVHGSQVQTMTSAIKPRIFICRLCVLIGLLRFLLVE